MASLAQSTKVGEFFDASHLQKALAIAALAGALAALGPFRLIWVVILAFALNLAFHVLRDALLDPDQLRSKTLGARPSAREIILQQLEPLPEDKAHEATRSNGGKGLFSEDHTVGAIGAHLGRVPLDVGVHLERPLDWACSLIVRDFVCWWYDPLANEDVQFPRQCRSILNAFFNHVTRQMREKNARDLLLSTIESSTNTLLVYLTEFRLFKVMATTTSTTLDEYLEANPMSALARLADREHQLGSLRNTSAGLLETHMNVTQHPLVLTIFREMFANQVLWKTVETVSDPDWLNRKIVELLRQDSTGVSSAAASAEKTAEADGKIRAALTKSAQVPAQLTNDHLLGNAVQTRTWLDSKAAETTTADIIQQILLLFETDKARAEEAAFKLSSLPEVEIDLSPDELELQQALTERGDNFFDFNAMVEDTRDKALLHMFSQITTFREVTAMMDPGPEVTRQDALIIFRTHFRDSADGTVLLDKDLREGILKSIILAPNKDLFVPLEFLAVKQLTSSYWSLFKELKERQGRDTSVDINRSAIGMDSDASSSTASIAAATLNPQDVQVSVTDISPDVDPMKPIVSKKDLEFMVAVEGLDGPMAPGFITMRKWLDFEQMDLALQKSLPRSTTSVGSTDFRRHAPLPNWKHQTSGNLCLGLQGYIKSLILDVRAGQSEALARFLDRENVGARRKWSEVPVIGHPLWAVGAVQDGIEGVGKNTWRAIGSLATPKLSLKNKSQASTRIGQESPTRSASQGNGERPPPQHIHVKSQSTAPLSLTARQTNTLQGEPAVGDSLTDSTIDSIKSTFTELPSNVTATAAAIGLIKPTSTTFTRAEIDLVIDSGIAVIEEMYDLAGRQFNVRRTVLNLLRQVVRRSYSESVRLALEGILEGQASEVKIAETLKNLTDSFWPNGEWASSKKSGEALRTPEDKAKTREEALAVLIASVPEVLKITLGGAATATAVNSLFELLQEKKLSRAIVTGLVLDFVRLFL